MLRLQKISKQYEVASEKVEALKEVTLAFRKNEFVSILGPSGCGKTTTLNIIGGLDRYSSGELFIAGKSTKHFSDHDWDIYRNRRIGFVFQSYNLIPHQTVLGNVELALTISGISKEERVERAKKALDKVGLHDQYNKKPNQLSGGQCQRVAIARAIVNEPEILLADEPTGALDTKTSKQIMDIIRDISKDTLVIMVTHNPEIAEEYSNRIIRLLDGEVVEDTNPYSLEEEEKEVDVLDNEVKNKTAKAKMSFWTAFKLSARNLFTKRGRTALTAIAGSIGIIGICSVLAVSNGVKGYISSMENDMLSGSPIVVAESSLDLNAIMSTMSTSEKIEATKVEEGYVSVDYLIQYIIDRYGNNMDSIMLTNNITKEYTDYISAMPKEYNSVTTFDYGLDLSNNIYTDYKVHSDSEGVNTSLTAIISTYISLLDKTDFSSYASLIPSLTSDFAIAPENDEYVLSQYDLKTGKIAHAKDEIMIVLDGKSALTDVLLAQLGYYTQDQFLNVAFKALEDPNYTSSFDKDKFAYDELLGKTFTYYDNDQVFSRVTGNPYSNFTYNPYSKGFKDGLDLKVVGILTPKEDISYGCMESGFYYTNALSQYIIETSADSEIVNFLNDNDSDAFTSMMSKTETGTTYIGITYQYQYEFEGEINTATGLIGETNAMTSLMSSMMGGASSTSVYTLSKRNLGGNSLPSTIRVYPKDFETKEEVLNYMNRWNSEEDLTINGVVVKAADREEITLTDSLSIIMNMIDSMVDIITVALIAFTSLSLVVSCVMIAIITYVSVVERVKEIGVIRSLGGRKRDVANLFNAETFIIGSISGVFGVLFTFILSVIVNLIVSAVAGINNIAMLSWQNVAIMILLSIVLTVLSGLIPASKASHQDPVNALRTE